MWANPNLPPKAGTNSPRPAATVSPFCRVASGSTLRGRWKDKRTLLSDTHMPQGNVNEKERLGRIAGFLGPFPPALTRRDPKGCQLLQVSGGVCAVLKKIPQAGQGLLFLGFGPRHFCAQLLHIPVSRLALENRNQLWVSCSLNFSSCSSTARRRRSADSDVLET